MRYNISIMTTHGSYEFVIAGGSSLPKTLREAYAKGDAITFTDVEGAEIILTPLNIVGIIIKAAAEDGSDEAEIEFDPPQG